MIQYAFSPYAFIAVTALLFIVPATLYLLWVRPKTSATYYLIGFLFCLIANFVLMYLFNAVYWWVVPLWPAQDALVVVSSFFLARFAYTFPQNEHLAEGKWVSRFFGLTTMLTLGWLAWFGWQFSIDPRTPVSDTFWLVMPIIIVLVFLVFLRRMVYFANITGNQSFWTTLRRPPNSLSLAFRTFALAVLSGMIQALASVNIAVAGFNIATFVPSETLIAVGSLLTVSLILMAYLNATAHQSTLIVRLVGAPLIVLLAVIGAVGIRVLLNDLHQLERTQPLVSQQIADGYRLGEQAELAYDEKLTYVAALPLAAQVSGADIEFLYQNPDTTALYPAERLSASIAMQPWANDVAEPAPVVSRKVMDARQRLLDYTAYQYRDGERVLEIGYVEPRRNAESQQVNTVLIGQMIFSTAVVLLVLPLFFRRTLIVPLDKLLEGVRRVNRGALQTTVPVTVEDEIGYLTNSFNDMTQSLYALTVGLEEKVRDRTRDLQIEIAERQRTEAQLEDAKEQAETANRAKTAFLANMSHELRTPLNAILGYTQIKQRESDDAATAIIARSGRHLLALIDDVLDLARIESGKIELRRRPVRLNAFLVESIELARNSAAEGVAIHLESHIAADKRVLLDATRLRQVLLNLIGNSVKFTEAGTVTLRVVAEEGGTYHFSVSDTGIGIAPDQLALIFSPLYQVPNEQLNAQGVGLGLSISSQIVALMGGELTVASRVGEGSTFSFTLKLSDAAGPAAEPFMPTRRHALLATGQDPRIVIIDDNLDNRNVLVAMLEPLGFMTEAYADARVALGVIAQQPPALVITDLVMPDFDGFTLIRELRRQFSAAELPIVVTSASVFSEDSQRSVEAGANAFLPKPVDLDQLINLIDTLLPLAWDSAETPLSSEVVQQAPATDIIATLYHAACNGDVTVLREQIGILHGQPDKQQFVAQVQSYLATFDLAELANWLTAQEHAVGESPRD
jgi:signal transduction histidine kinase/FixJ family two-component response regulator